MGQGIREDIQAMILGIIKRRSLAVSIAAALGICLFVAVPRAKCQNPLVGNWTATITIPSGPGSTDMVSSTVTFNVSPRGNSLVGRMTITDDQGQVVAGVWRNVGKQISITYEMPCDPTSTTPCGTLVLRGKVKTAVGQIKGTTAFVMWDKPNGQNPALYSTSNGSFSAAAAP
jgi:hypothetical protein